MKTCLFALTACFVLSAPVLRADLVAHWPLDSGPADVSGNEHHGAVVGNSVTFGQPGASAKTGTSALFTGIGHIDVPWSAALNPGTQAPDGSGSFTVAFWANPSAAGGGTYRSPFTSREENGTVNGPLIYNDAAGNWTYWAGNNGPSGAWNPLDAEPVQVDTWTHVAILYDAATTTRKMYLNGVEVINQIQGVSANLARALHIGGGADDGNSFTWEGLIDDMGFWDHALTEAEIQNIMTNGIDSVIPVDPRLRVVSPVILALNGAVQQFDISLGNAGETQPLNITGTTFTGTSAAGFSVVATPGAIAPGGTGILKIAFNPAGATGNIEADLNISSNDAADPVRTVTLRGTIHDPQFTGDPLLNFGKLPVGAGPQTKTLAIKNMGGGQELFIDAVNVTGPMPANFTVTSFPATLAPGASGTISVTFDRIDGEGTFGAFLEISTNDSLNPVISVPMKAEVAFVNPLLAWWPLDEDARDASGNGFEGIVIEPVIFGEEGANAATGTSAVFEGGGHIDVPYDARLNPGLSVPDGSGSFTVTLWAYPTAIGDGHHSPFTAREDNGVTSNGPIIYIQPSGHWSYWAGNHGPAGAWNSFDGPLAVAGAWTHVAISYDSDTTTRKMFIDGAEVINHVIGVSANSVRDLHIGAGQDDGANFFWAGRIDDVGLFRKALSAAEVSRVMTGGVNSLSTPPPAEEFVITGFSQDTATGQVTISWKSSAGRNYQAQRSGNLADWSNVGAVVAGTGSNASFTDTTLPAGTKIVFYRIVIVP